MGAETADEIKILMVAEDKNVVDQYRALVETQPDFCVVYDTASEMEALGFLAEHKVDVMILDPELEEGDGVSLLAEIEEQNLEKPFTVVVTNHSSNVTLSYMRAHGADYIYRKTNAAYTPMRVMNVIRKIYPYKCFAKPCREPALVTEFNEQQEDLLMRENLMCELEQMGMKRQMVGFRFLVEAIMLYIKSPEEQIHITNDIYPEVAKMMHVTTMSVERSIRCAIESAFTRANIIRLQRYYPFPYDDEHGRPTNTQFISNMAGRIRIRDLKKEAVIRQRNREMR